MNLSEAIAADQGTRKGPQCGLYKIRRQLAESDDPKQADQLDQLLAEIRDGTRSAAAVSRILARVGIHYTGNSLQRHAREGCQSCPKP